MLNSKAYRISLYSIQIVYKQKIGESLTLCRIILDVIKLFGVKVFL